MDSSSPVNPQDAPRCQERTERLLACFQKALGHELPNQLVAIQGLVYLLQEEESDRLGPDGRICLGRLAAVVKRTHTLVRELADVGRAVRRAATGGEARLRETALEVLAEVKQLSPGQRIEYDVADPGVPLPVPEDGLRRVLAALLRDAVRRAGGRPLRVELGACTTAAGTDVWLADDAPPLSDAERRQLFEPLAPAAEPENALRLFLAALLVDAWGGSLDVQATAGGNRFSITLRSKD
jgi:signal transduction histidine kinase